MEAVEAKMGAYVKSIRTKSERRLSLRILIGLIISITAGFVFPTWAHSQEDEIEVTSDDSIDLTDFIMRRMQDTIRTEQERTATPANLRILLMSTAAARTIWETNRFDIPDDHFQRQDFFNFVLDRYATAINDFHRLTLSAGLQLPALGSVILILDDLGDERRSTVSSTYQGTRVMQLDVRRWHKIYRGYFSELGTATSIHEFSHIVQYQWFPAATRIHREMGAILIEALELFNQRGQHWFARHYPTDFVGRAPRPTSSEFLVREYRSSITLRFMAADLITAALNHQLELERFAFSYLRGSDSPRFTAEDAVAVAARTSGLNTALGRDFTWQRWQEDSAHHE